jgi:transposase, IS5 family
MLFSRKLEEIRSIDLMNIIAINAVRKEIDRYCGLGDRVIDQARRRVLEGEQVPNEQKLFSIFETRTRFDQARQDPQAG